MSLKEKIISGINEIRTGNKITYECLLLLSSTDLAKWQLAVGESAPWIAPDAEIRSLNKTYLADGSWTLRVIAEISARNKVCPTIRLNENDILQIVEESYDVSAVFFPLEWFGCRTATAADCPPFTDTSMETISGGKTKYLALDGTWATPGMILAINGTPLCFSSTGQLLHSADPGSMDFSKSPFSDEIPAAFMRQSISTRLYRCSFYTRKEMHKIDGFCGVNGKFGNRCHIKGADTGRWLAKAQRLKQVTAMNGKTFTRVERVMIEAPGDLHWDCERNGGIWTW